MPVNSDRPSRWKEDITRSVDFFNEWFMRFAPEAYTTTRLETTARVKSSLEQTKNLTHIQPAVLRQNPWVLPMLRMTTAPPLARDRLIGLSKVPAGLVRSIELHNRIPSNMKQAMVDVELEKICRMIINLADRDIFPWLEHGQTPTQLQIYRAATIVADRLCGAMADPIIRNAQEQRQLATIREWLEQRGYLHMGTGRGVRFDTMDPGTFAFHLNVLAKLRGGSKHVNIPVDVAIMPLKSVHGDLPLLIEAKSAGDFTNTNKRRKEEATKVAQLRDNYGGNLQFLLFLCGYFDSGYLGYEAAEGIDWIWEHRIEDFVELGV